MSASVTTHKPSAQQEAIFDWIKNGTGNAVIEAVAGSGKTTTLIQALDVIGPGKRVAFGAYNKKIADEIKTKVGFRDGVFINTAHAFGYSIWRRAYPNAQIDALKKYDMIKDALRIPDALDEIVKDLISLGKQSLFGIKIDDTKPSPWVELIAHHDLDLSLADTNGKRPPNLEELVSSAIQFAIQGLAKSRELADKIIDFDDMIYMPLVTNQRFYTYDWVFIDECQDTNDCRRELFRRMLKRDGRLVAVGDGAQAIYGFTGADADALNLIAEEFECVRLPLTVSYRCAKNVIDTARRWVNHIQPAPNAKDGVVRSIEEYEFFAEKLHATDAILCRNTAPLVKMAYNLLRRNVPCHVEGKEIGQGLIKLTAKWKSIKTVGAFLKKLESYTTVQIEQLTRTKKLMQAQVIIDKVETLNVLAENLALDESLDVLRNKIELLFTDTNGQAAQTLTLSTIHKSKGREWKRVYWLGRARYQPSPYAKQDWQMEQETNLMYVAATRAMEELVDVVVQARS